MKSTSPEKDNPSKYFGFDDAHGFKDFIAYVMLSAPDRFMPDSWLKPEEQMTLERAFYGLRYGIELTRMEKGDRAVLKECERIVSEAYGLYRAGFDVEGYEKLKELEKAFRTIRAR